MEKKFTISNKVYQLVVAITGIIMLINIAGLWVTWNSNQGSNVFGYVIGAIALFMLLLCGAFALLNNRFVIRRQCIFHFCFAAAHLIFFIIIIVGAKKGTYNSNVPAALFTVLLAAIFLADLYMILKERLANRNKQYDFVDEYKDKENEPFVPQPKPEQPVEKPVEQPKVEEPKKPEEPAKPEEPKPAPLSDGIVSL